MRSPIESEILGTWVQDVFEDAISYRARIGNNIDVAIIKRPESPHMWQWITIMKPFIMSNKEYRFSGHTETMKEALEECYKYGFNLLLVRMIYGEKGIDRWNKSIREIYQLKRISS